MKAWPLVVLFVVGCRSSFPDPIVATVTPDRGWVQRDEPINIRGLNFYPKVVVNARTGELEVDDDFSVRLLGPLDSETQEAHPLSRVSLTDYTHIEADVPAGLPTGLYDLIVETPTGRSAAHLNAYTVSENLADKLSLDTTSVQYEVNKTALLEIGLLDPLDEPVPDNLSIVVEVVSETGADTVSAVFGTGLENQEEISITQITGDLGADGIAVVPFTLTRPDTVTIRVSPRNRFGADSTVDKAEERLVFVAGSDLQVDIRLPNDDFKTVAGEEFAVELQLIDQFGNEVNDATEAVLLRSSCASPWFTSVDLTGHAVVTASVQEATGSTPCNTDRIVSVVGPPGQSADFGVLPAEIAAFQVQTVHPSVVAGDVLAQTALVEPVDRFGNNTSWSGTALTVTDSLGGVTGQNCSGGGGSLILCEATSTIAGEGVTMQIEDEKGVTGGSGGYEVVPAEAESVEIAVSSQVVIAGEAVDVAVSVLDRFGNTLRAEDLDQTSFEFSSDVEIPNCTALAVPPDARAWFACVLETAVEQTTVRVTVDDESLPVPIAAASDPIDVVNGPLTGVAISHPGTAAAGDPVPVDFAAFDAFGNPVQDAAGTALTVSDTSGRMAIGAVELDAAGLATSLATFEAAGITTLSASISGVGLGDSPPLAVSAGPATTFAVDAAAWVWVDVSSTVAVTALDDFGNVASYDGTVQLESTVSDAFSNVPVDLDGGAGSIDLVWTAPQLNDQLSVSDGTLSGGSKAVSAVLDCSGSGTGPTVDLQFGGFDHAIACFNNASGDGTILGDLSGSTGTDLVQYILAVQGGSADRDPTDPVRLVTVDAIGAFSVWGLVVQSDFCAAEAHRPAWVGPDDGSPVGPLELAVDDAEIDAGVDTTELSVTGATDCTRDPADGGSVFLRTDRGQLVGLAPTGEGLTLELDSSGDGVATIDATGVSTGGTTTVSAWVASGAGGGAVSLLIDQDSRFPVVWEQTPSGDTSGGVSTIELLFSEPLLPSSVSPASFSVSGPSSVGVIDAALTDVDRVQLTLDGPVSSGAGVWTVNAFASGSAGVRDDAGNRLDGSWIGVPGDYSGTFGDLPILVEHVSLCTAPSVFRPDGDPGVGAEADVVAVQLESPSTPAFWVVSVEDSVGTLLRREFVPALDRIDAWGWDGRDIDEGIVANGTYTLRFETDDGFGNRGGACTVAVTVDNREGT